jgi:hypothetical protein
MALRANGVPRKWPDRAKVSHWFDRMSLLGGPNGLFFTRMSLFLKGRTQVATFCIVNRPPYLPCKRAEPHTVRWYLETGWRETPSVTGLKGQFWQGVSRLGCNNLVGIPPASCVWVRRSRSRNRPSGLASSYPESAGTPVENSSLRAWFGVGLSATVDGWLARDSIVHLHTATL